MCLYPRKMVNPRYKRNKKNGGNVPAVPDNRVRIVPIGCGVCMECMRQKASSWRVRLLEDIKENKNGIFVTLTFSDNSYKKLYQELEGTGYTGYAMDNEIAKLAVRRFYERHRKHYKKSIRHWLVTELGHRGTENIHLHGIVWTNLPKERIGELWAYGFIWAGYNNRANYVNEQTVNYIVKYVTKQDITHPNYKPIILTSAGIGRSYVNSHNFKQVKYKGKETDYSYTTSTGHKIALPHYYKQKMFTDEEREKLWIHKLDEGVIYVNKQKIDMVNRPQDYERALQQARALNNKLGYQEPRHNTDQLKKEIKRRIQMQQKRLKNSTTTIRNNKTHKIKSPDFETPGVSRSRDARTKFRR